MESTGFSVPNSAENSADTVTSTCSATPAPQKVQKLADGTKGVPKTRAPSQPSTLARAGPRADATGAPSVQVVSGPQRDDTASVRSRVSINSSRSSSSRSAMLKLAGAALKKERDIAETKLRIDNAELKIIQHKIAIAEQQSDRGSECSARSAGSLRKVQSQFAPESLNDTESENELSRRRLTTLAVRGRLAHLPR